MHSISKLFCRYNRLLPIFLNRVNYGESIVRYDRIVYIVYLLPTPYLDESACKTCSN